MKLRIIFQSAKDRAANEAAYAGDFDRALHLIASGANPNAKRWITSATDTHGWEGNIGFAAIHHGRGDALAKALDLGLDPNLTMQDTGISLLRMAIVSRQEDMALLLIDKGADLSSYRNGGFDNDLYLTSVYDLPKAGKEMLRKLKIFPKTLKSTATPSRSGFNP